MYQCVFQLYYNHNLSKFSYKSMLNILKTQLVFNIFFIFFSYIKILHTLCVAYHKLNVVHHCFIMKVLKNFNRFFHVYAINVTMTTCGINFLVDFTMLSPNSIFELNDFSSNG
jgi:hypothetical protein